VNISEQNFSNFVDRTSLRFRDCVRVDIECCFKVRVAEK
jgi:hypothetical protein